ncbi:uncharacterized protein LODBEIA_P52630 [Lodderomyces beijingensis]|uniref:Rap-GAP domain-containing protein n=1 Tax=Lodderomyces beijingensis TaxID=1775926 RepID=A0ABP0ZSC0_9ASCO
MSTHHPSFGTSSGIGSVFKSLTKSFKQTSTKNVPVSINPVVVGGDENLQHLINQIISKSSSSSSQLKALRMLTRSIQKYSISSVQEIWYIVRHFCDIKQPPEIRRQALQLCIACMEKDDNSVGTKTRYFVDIYNYCRLSDSDSDFDPDFDLFLSAMAKLTHGGTDIHDLIILEDAGNFLKWIDTILIVICRMSEQGKLDDAQTSKNKLENLEQAERALNFINECIIQSAPVLGDRACNGIADKLVKFKIDTKNDTKNNNNDSSSSTINACVVDIIFTISKNCLVESQVKLQVLRYFCTLYGQCQSRHDSLAKRIVEAVEFLCLHPGHTCVPTVLLDQMVDAGANCRVGTPNSKDFYCCSGSIFLTQQLYIMMVVRREQMFKLPHFSYLNALKSVLMLGHPQLNKKILQSLAMAFKKDEYETNFGVSPLQSMERLFPFQVWYVEGHSLYDVLKLVKVDDEEDAKNLTTLCDSLIRLFESSEISTPRDTLINFLLGCSKHLSQMAALFVLDSCDEDKSCSLLNPLWKEASFDLLNNFYYRKDCVSVQVRVKSIEVLINAHETSRLVYGSDQINHELLIDVLRKSIDEKDEKVLEVLSKLTYLLFTKAPAKTFEKLVTIFIPQFAPKSQTPKNEVLMSRGFVTSVNTPVTLPPKMSMMSSMSDCSEFLCRFADSLCRAFVEANPERSKMCYDAIMKIANNSVDGQVLLIIAKCLVRLRVTNEDYLYFVRPSDMSGLASAFKRDSPVKSPGQMWAYPEEVSCVTEQFLDKPRQCLRVEGRNISSKVHITGVQYLDIRKWFKIVLFIFENFVDWEVYSYVWAHFCAQLSNMRLFINYDAEIVALKSIVCNQLKLNLPSQLTFPANETITKGDLQVAFVRTFSALIGYHDKFSKNDEDEIIDSLIFGLSSWDKTAIPCINILTICCFEIPLSVKKFLGLILTKLQTRVTSVNASTHTLEFLMALIHLPILTSSFTIEEYKRVFGIAIKYVEYARDMESRNDDVSSHPNSPHSRSNGVQLHGIDAVVENAPSTRQSSSGVSPILLQYIKLLSYNVLCSWFLRIEMGSRKKVSAFLIKSLISCDEKDVDTNGSKMISDESIGLLDFITRFTYSDYPLKFINSSSSSSKRSNDGMGSSSKTSLNRWVVGTSVVAIETDVHSGDTEIMIRKPTGVSRLFVQLDHGNNVGKEAAVGPNYYLLQLFDSKVKPTPIIEDSTILRGLSVLDRIPSVEFHKAGIIYVGKGQTTENEVLLNRIGSADYQEFLRSIGDLTELEGNRTLYCGGLDTDNNVDGKYTRFWRDQLTQIVFHIATMMEMKQDQQQVEAVSKNEPQFHDVAASIERQKQVDLKKRHIGNNFVNIYFDESGSQDFNFNLIKSQFNFLNIVISPCTVSQKYDSPDMSTGGSPGHVRKFFRIKTYRRSGVPAVFSTSHFKLVSQDQLPTIVRNLVMLADQFANVWHNSSGEFKYTSNWAQRVKQLRIINTRALANYEKLKKDTLAESQVSKANQAYKNKQDLTRSFLEQLDGNALADDEADNHEFDFDFDFNLNLNSNFSNQPVPGLQRDAERGQEAKADSDFSSLYNAVEFNSFTS